MMTRTARASVRPAPWMVCASSVALLLAGCAGSLLKSAAEAPDTFRLSAAATGAATASTTQPTSALAIAVARPRAAAAIDTDRIAVHSAGNRFDYYSAARWAESAPQMLQDNLVSALTATAQFGGGVMTAPARVPTELLLDVELRRFEAVTAGADAASPGAAPVIHMQVQASLFDLRRAARITSFVSEATVPAAENRLSAVVAAFDLANAQVVSDIAARVQAAAAALPVSP